MVGINRECFFVSKADITACEYLVRVCIGGTCLQRRAYEAHTPAQHCRERSKCNINVDKSKSASYIIVFIMGRFVIYLMTVRFARFPLAQDP